MDKEYIMQTHKHTQHKAICLLDWGSRRPFARRQICKGLNSHIACNGDHIQQHHVAYCIIINYSETCLDDAIHGNADTTNP
jgi:hypothetical protein